MDLPATPSHIAVEAKRGLTPIPKAVGSNRDAMRLVLALRRSEMRYRRGLVGSVRHYETVRRVYAKKGGKK